MLMDRDMAFMMFTELVTELQLLVLEHCRREELLALAQTSSHMHSLATPLIYHTIDIQIAPGRAITRLPRAGSRYPRSGIDESLALKQFALCETLAAQPAYTPFIRQLSWVFQPGREFEAVRPHITAFALRNVRVLQAVELNSVADHREWAEFLDTARDTVESVVVWQAGGRGTKVSSSALGMARLREHRIRVRRAMHERFEEFVVPVLKKGSWPKLRRVVLRAPQGLSMVEDPEQDALGIKARETWEELGMVLGPQVALVRENLTV